MSTLSKPIVCSEVTKQLGQSRDLISLALILGTMRSVDRLHAAVYIVGQPTSCGHHEMRIWVAATAALASLSTLFWGPSVKFVIKMMSD